MTTTPTRGPSLIVAAIQTRHASQIVESVLADVQHLVRTHAGSTAIEIVQRDQAVAPLMAAAQLLASAAIAVRALADRQPKPLTPVEQAAECEGRA